MLTLARNFKRVEGRDSSESMIDRARKRTAHAGIEALFEEGNILEARESSRSFDFVFVSLALSCFRKKK